MRVSLLLLFLAVTPARGNSNYIGSEACSKCHPGEYAREIRSRHARALRPILQSPVTNFLVNAARPADGLRYEQKPEGIVATAQRGSAQISARLEWAFGAGAQGITPVGRSGGRYFENRLSYYSAPGRLALTYGHPLRADNAPALLGVLQSDHAITSCFGCHATNVEWGAQAGNDRPDMSSLQPGVQCERCHGPGRAHAEAATSGAIVNPGRFSAKAQVEICGQCHRLPEAGNNSPEPELEDPVNVRFAPFGLMASRCFRVSGKLTCTTCHDPHEDAQPRTAGFYSTRCIGCHTGPPSSGSRCRRAARIDCLPCHMRQARLGPYLKFTDHRIRID